MPDTHKRSLSKKEETKDYPKDSEKSPRHMKMSIVKANQETKYCSVVHIGLWNRKLSEGTYEDGVSYALF